MSAAKIALLAVLLAACGHLPGGDAPAPVPVSMGEACTETRQGARLDGCVCIIGGSDGAWGPHWGRPIRLSDGGMDYIHGTERWCPKWP